ncbi:condensation domain-containing protein [Kiloniella sp. b19]|uniref:condensation domain-containing protein n=1 Tax=Kiloniella sp. GXU_MW_B19 TaxID=3141326 RepID=UPI0031DA75B4
MNETANLLLTDDEMARFQQGLSELENSEPASSSNNNPETPGEYEQAVWLLQQQEPELDLSQTGLWTLSEKPDLLKLINAAQTLLKKIPSLQSLYNLNDEDDFIKSPGAPDQSLIDVVPFTTEEQASEIIRHAQQSVGHFAENPAFKILVLVSSGTTLIALIKHRILDQAGSAASLMQALAALYNTRNHSRLEIKPDFLLPLNRLSAPSAVPWIKRHTGQDAPISTGAFATQNGRSNCSHVELQQENLQLSAEDENSLYAQITAHFGRFICTLGGHKSLVLELQSELNSNDVNRCFEYLLNLDQTIEATADQLLDLHRTEALADNSETHNLPFVSIRWHESNPEIKLGQAPLQTRHSSPGNALNDLTLSLLFCENGKLRLTLETGQGVSDHVSAFLLESFCDVLLNSGTGCRGENLPTLRAHPTQQPAPARNPDETPDRAKTAALILAEFRDALSAPRMTADEDFFDYGGHSLIATRIIGFLLEKHGIELHFNDLFSNPTANSLARKAKLSEGATLPADTANTQASSGTAPLSIAQMSLWKAYAAFGFGEIFNIPFALDFLQPVDENVFRLAFRDILERHAGLRALFIRTETEVHQEIIAIDTLDEYKWFWSSEESQGVTRHDEAGHVFDLSKELPIRLRFLKDTETGRQTLSFLFHHIVLDEWSVNLMMDELAKAYKARTSGQAPVWTTSGQAPLDFTGFARLQKERGLDPSHLAYWVDDLKDAPQKLDLFPEDQSTAKAEGESSPEGGWIEFKLDRQTSDGLYHCARENNASLFNVTYAAIAASLQSLGALKDLVVGTSASGRTDPAYFDTIGYFTTVVAHRIRFETGMTAPGLIEAVKNTVNGSMPYTDVPIDLVEEALGMAPGKDHLFEVFIQIHAQNKLNGVLEAEDRSEINFRQVDPDKHESLLGLQFEVMEEVIRGERSIRVLMSYRADRYNEERVKQIRDKMADMFELFSSGSTASLVEVTR